MEGRQAFHEWSQLLCHFDSFDDAQGRLREKSCLKPMTRYRESRKIPHVRSE